MVIVANIVGVVLSYLVGGVPFGYLVGRMAGIDVRRFGSGNIGATNVLRVLGKDAGISTLVLDVLKGVFAVLFIEWAVARIFGLGDTRILYVLCGAAAIVGHTFTPFLGFKGGKGVATALGAWLVLAPIPTLIALGVFILLVATWRYISLGSIFAAAALPAALVLFNLGHIREILPRLVFAGLLAVLIIARHHGNIARLLKGTENKLKF